MGKFYNGRKIFATYTSGRSRYVSNSKLWVRWIICLYLATIPVFAAPTTFQNDSAKILNKLNILKGYEDQSLKLDNKITRSEFITLVIRMLGCENDKNSQNSVVTFKDIQKNHWAYGNFKTAIKHKLITGYPGNIVLPDNNVTYPEALAILIRALKYEKSLPANNWPQNVINLSRTLNITKNVESIAHNKQLTRGEVCVLIYNSMWINFN